MKTAELNQRIGETYDWINMLDIKLRTQKCKFQITQ